MSLPQEVADTLRGAGITTASDVPESMGGSIVEDDGQGRAIVRWAGPPPGRLADCREILEQAGYYVEPEGIDEEPRLRVSVAQ